MIAFRESAPRKAIVDFLTNRRDHPSATMIFQGLKSKISSLSLGTVYRNLDILTKQGRIRMINIDQKESRYDSHVTSHGHFFCQVCGKLEDISLKQHCCQMVGSLNKQGYSVSAFSLDIKGTCSGCLKNETSKE